MTHQLPLLPMAKVRSAEVDVQSIERQIAAIAQYARLREVYNIDLRDAVEQTLSADAKAAYCEKMVRLLDSIEGQYDELASLQKKVFRSQKKPLSATFLASILTQLSPFDQTKEYALASFLAELGARHLPVYEPEQFFLEKQQELQHALFSLQKAYQMQQQLRASTTRRSPSYRGNMGGFSFPTSSRSRTTSRPSSRSSGGRGWSGSSGSFSVFSGGGSFGGGGRGKW